jgi:hypothetical protein
MVVRISIFAEVGDDPLKFVLKLDEAEIMHGKKFERVSITLMNRALDPEVIKNDERYFSVQSEQEIWPIACFLVAKESYEVLKWTFSQTKFPEVIAAQESGQPLVVPDIGTFKVEWHLSADMKTIKCMYGLSGGAMSKFACVYCNQERQKSVVVSAPTASLVAKSRAKNNWNGGLFARSVSMGPAEVGNRDRWKPILPIPLERVHICTLHALTRITEKLIHLHIMFIWNMSNPSRKEVAIVSMGRSLSARGMHGGNVVISKDIDHSGPNSNIPKKPSLSGVNAGKLFQPSTWSGQDRVWKDILRSEDNQLQRGQAYLGRVATWTALEQIYPYLCGLTLTNDQRAVFQTKVEEFGRLFIRNFGEEHVTHYMVSIFIPAYSFVRPLPYCSSRVFIIV